MYCKNCGTQMNDNAAFCPACGAKAAGVEQNDYQNNYYAESYQYDNYQPDYYQQDPYQVQHYDPAATPEAERYASKSLTFGILSLVFGGILGIIFAGIARNNAVFYQEQIGELAGKVKVGHTLGTVGLILSIISTVLGVCTIIWYVLYLGIIMSALGLV